jgi:hypothetical protein
MSVEHRAKLRRRRPPNGGREAAAVDPFAAAAAERRRQLQRVVLRRVLHALRACAFSRRIEPLFRALRERRNISRVWL